jgi:septal ring factor EnvC (AmiA/AmiB activator)
MKQPSFFSRKAIIFSSITASVLALMLCFPALSAESRILLQQKKKTAQTPRKNSSKNGQSNKKSVAAKGTKNTSAHKKTSSTTQARTTGQPNKATLRNLQREIERDRAKLRAMKQQERKTTQTIQAFKEKDKVLHSSLRQLSTELQRKEDSLRKTSHRIGTTEGNAQIIRRQYAGLVRAVGVEGEASQEEYLSLKGAMEQELLTEALVRSIAQTTDKRLGIVQQVRDSLREAQERFRSEYGETATLKNRTESEKNKVKGTLQEQQKELREIQTNKQELIKEIESKKSSAKKLASIIANMASSSNASRNTSNKEASGTSSSRTNDDDASNQAATEARAASVRGGFRRHSLPFPTDGTRILHTFGKHTNSATGTVIENPGIDIQTPQGSAVRAVAKGTVTLVNWLPGYGSLVIIDHGNTFRTVYANLASVGIRQGQAVKAGTVLGKSGRAADGEYVHFEIWHDRHKLNPAVWLQ